ncbi:MAG: prolipoprotein diacylglyceryl transferase family protein [Mycobacterium sp.]
MSPEWHVPVFGGSLAVPVHGLFVALGVLAAAVVFTYEARRRGAVDEQSVVAVAGALIGGAIGMRLSGWARHLDFGANPNLLQAWEFGSKSILGGLLGAYLGVLIAKRIGGYRGKTGDLFAPAVALGMAIGRIGCHLTEAPGRPTGLPWGIHAPGTTPECPGCLAGQAMHPSYLYEIAFQLTAFVVLMSLRSKIGRPGELFVLYIAAYALFRFVVEFVRANETVWLDLTRPQWFLLPSLVILGFRLWWGHHRGYYRPAARNQEVHV